MFIRAGAAIAVSPAPPRNATQRNVVTQRNATQRCVAIHCVALCCAVSHHSTFMLRLSFSFPFLHMYALDYYIPLSSSTSFHFYIPTPISNVNDITVAAWLRAFVLARIFFSFFVFFFFRFSFFFFFLLILFGEYIINIFSPRYILYGIIFS